MCVLRHLLLSLVIATRVSSTASSDQFTVTGWYGDNVTLPCRYDAQTHSSLDFCWGRAKVPTSKCSSTVLSWADGDVTSTRSPKYRLLGRVEDGDVSLTILNAQGSDGGEYGCRVEIPGWFNDQKVNIRLVMEEAPIEEPTTEEMMVTTPETGAETSTPVQKNNGGTASAEEAPLVVKMQLSSVFTFENFLGVRNLCRLVAVFFLTMIAMLVFALRGGFLQKRMVECPGTSATDNIYASIPELQPASSPYFYKT